MIRIIIRFQPYSEPHILYLFLIIIYLIYYVSFHWQSLCSAIDYKQAQAGVCVGSGNMTMTIPDNELPITEETKEGKQTWS